MNIKDNQQGNIIIIVIVVSSILIGVGVSVLSSTTQSSISSSYASSSATANYEAEGNLEEALYVFSGHELGFESSFDPNESTYSTQYDSVCEILTTDAWCLETRINELNGLIPHNGFLSLGMYNDTSAPYDSDTLIGASLQNIDPHPTPSGSTDFILQLFSESGTPENNNTVSFGDRRATNITIGLTEYLQNTRVEENDADINSALQNLTTYNAEYLITGNDQVWVSGEHIYHDIDGDEIVSIGDIRMNQYKNFAPNTFVSSGDGDIGQTLHPPQNLGIIPGSHPAEIYATTIGVITISGIMDNGTDEILESWNYTLSKNDLSGSSATSPFIVSWDTFENTNVDSIAQRTIEEFFDHGANWSATRWNYTGSEIIEKPILKITVLNANIAYIVSSSDDASATNEPQLTYLYTTLTATTQESSAKQTFQIDLSNSQIIPLFGSADIVY